MARSSYRIKVNEHTRLRLTEEGSSEELPFEMLVLGDFSGEQQRTALHDRLPTNVTLANFDQVLEFLSPRLQINWEFHGTWQKTQLVLDKMVKFTPGGVLQQLVRVPDSPAAYLWDAYERLEKEAASTRRKKDSPVRSEVNGSGEGSSEEANSEEASIWEWLNVQRDRNPVMAWMHQEFENQKAKESPLIANRFRCWVKQQLDQLVCSILHQPRFQQLEARYRALYRLCDSFSDQSKIRISLFDISAEELKADLGSRDLRRSSLLYKKIYFDRFERPYGPAEVGDPKAVGYPFNLIVGDYYLAHEKKGQGDDDLAARVDLIDATTLNKMSILAADCFAPFVCGVAPSMLGIESFQELEGAKKVLNEVLHDRSRTVWNMFRGSANAKFVGLIVPRVLARPPYHGPQEYFVQEEVPERGVVEKDYSFVFYEKVGPSNEHLLWANGAFSFAAVAAKSFQHSGWFADMRGFLSDNLDEGGMVNELPTLSASTDATGVVPICPTEVMVSEHDDALLSELGFIALYTCQHTGNCCVLSCRSASKVYTSSSIDFELSTMLNYILCVCRFGHLLKRRLIAKVGQIDERKEVQRDLDQFVKQYVTQSTNTRIRKEKPLSFARIRVENNVEDPGVYDCFFELAPHFQFDNVEATISLQTLVNKGQ